MRFKLMAAFVAAVLAVPAVAQDNRAAPSPAPAKEKKICRSQGVTGSMFPQRTCHTAAEWQQIEEDNSAAVRSFNNHKNVGK